MVPGTHPPLPCLPACPGCLKGGFLHSHSSLWLKITGFSFLLKSVISEVLLPLLTGLALTSSRSILELAGIDFTACRRSLAAPHRRHPCSASTAKTWPHKPNTVILQQEKPKGTEIIVAVSYKWQGKKTLINKQNNQNPCQTVITCRENGTFYPNIFFLKKV